MLAVKLSSRGPAIYSQARVGRRGAPFVIYKLRTMAHDCERATGPRWATAGDARITPLGRVLRRTHLDELPQLWNILRGEMSLVGPRPERPEFVAQLRRALPRYAERLAVRPGVTGLAQVHLPPDVDLESVRRKLDFDLHYVRSMGPVLDLQVLTATLLGLLGVPYPVACRTCLVPGRAAIEGAARPAAVGAEAPAQVQPV
jgi:lipopolysaccharide/colanic/teichoic acid biosynthesis glycosyltransferase